MAKQFLPEVVVNGETISRAAIAAEAQNHPAPKGKPGIAWRKAANALAIRTLLLQEAKRRGIAAAPVPSGPGRRETDEEAMIRQLLEAEIMPEPPSDDALLAEWRANPERYRTQPLWKASHILAACAVGDEPADAAAKAKTEAIRQRISEDPATFEALAAAHSDCPSKTAGGALGQLRPGDVVPEFEQALRAIGGRGIAKSPVRTRHGWHVLRVDAYDPPRALPFAAVRDRISEAMEKAAWARESKRFVDRLAADAEITGADLGS